jgi:hypothetical protein
VACELAMMGALPGSASQRNGERLSTMIEIAHFR